MKIIEKIKAKIKGVARKIAGSPENVEPNFATIYIVKNNQNVYKIESTSSDIVNGICEIISYFHKYNDYKIIYNYISKEIYIRFTVKKGNDVECTNDE